MQEMSVRSLGGGGGGGEIPWKRKCQLTPVFFPGKSHEQRSLTDYSPWDHKRVGHDLVTKQLQQQKLQYVIDFKQGEYTIAMD